MSKIILLVSALFALSACSSSSGGSKSGDAQHPAVAAFEKASAGQWLSECQHDGNGNFTEQLTINTGGTGSTSFQYFQNQNCTGNVIQSVGPIQFTYSALAENAGTIKISVKAGDQPAVEAEVTTQGGAMTIATQQKVTHYSRMGLAPGENHTEPAGPPELNSDFDSAARGNWVSQNCYQNGNSTVRILLSFYGNGRASTAYNVYQSANCIGNPQPSQSQNFTFTVDRYGNGGGQITINGEPSDVIFQGSKMSMSSAQGTVDYLRIN